MLLKSRQLLFVNGSFQVHLHFPHVKMLLKIFPSKMPFDNTIKQLALTNCEMFL